MVVANWGNVLRQAVKIGTELLSTSGQKRGAGVTHPRARGRSAPTADRARTVGYAPDLDGAADPGEIVWAWVPFEEGDGRGKGLRHADHLVQDGADLLGLMLSSQHDRAGEPDWLSVGTGAWDRQARESFVRLDRVIEVGEHEIRREGAVLDRDRFDRVADALRTRFGWS